MLVTATSALPVARTRETAGDACATAALRAGGLYGVAMPRGAEHVAVASRRDENGNGTAVPGGRVQPLGLTWPTSIRPTTFPRGESSASSRPV